jgi:5-formyltetrahydrofolate cyclo-ligase
VTSNISTAIARDRIQGLRARRSLSKQERLIASERIASRVLNSHEFMAARSLACYLAADDEVDTYAIVERAWRAKKRIFAPVVDFRGRMVFRELLRETELETNLFGLWEPNDGATISPNRLDVVITPVVTFDDAGHRVGMGGGYFDRCFAFLAHRNHWLHPKLIGLAFDCQKIEKIHSNPWDIGLYRVFTESG